MASTAWKKAEYPNRSRRPWDEGALAVGRKMNKAPHPYYLLLIASALVGCATERSEMSVYLDVPTTCGDLEAEMLAHANYDMWVHRFQTGVGLAAQGVTAAAGAGIAAPGLAYAQTGVAALNQVNPPTREKRMDVLFAKHTAMGCPPIHLEEDPEPEYTNAKPGGF